MPCVLGHEGVGVVVQAGQGRDSKLAGKRVSWSLVDSCGVCLPCARWGIPQKCDHLFKYGHAGLIDGSGLNGCFATHLILRPGTAVFEVPERVTDVAAVTANCALATIFAMLDCIPSEARTVVVQGAGMLGVHACAVLQWRGIEQVVLVDSSASRLASTPRFSAESLIPWDAVAFYKHLADAVLEVAGSPSAIRDGLDLLRPGGCYVLAGMVHPQSMLELRGEEIVRGCITMRGVHNYTPRHLRLALEFLESEAWRYPWDQLVSAPFGLDRIEDAFAEAGRRKWHRVAVAPGG